MEVVVLGGSLLALSAGMHTMLKHRPKIEKKQSIEEDNDDVSTSYYQDFDSVFADDGPNYSVTKTAYGIGDPHLFRHNRMSGLEYAKIRSRNRFIEEGDIDPEWSRKPVKPRGGDLMQNRWAALGPMSWLDPHQEVQFTQNPGDCGSNDGFGYIVDARNRKRISETRYMPRINPDTQKDHMLSDQGSWVGHGYGLKRIIDKFVRSRFNKNVAALKGTPTISTANQSIHPDEGSFTKRRTVEQAGLNAAPTTIQLTPISAKNTQDYQRIRKAPNDNKPGTIQLIPQTQKPNEDRWYKLALGRNPKNAGGSTYTLSNMVDMTPKSRPSSGVARPIIDSSAPHISISVPAIRNQTRYKRNCAPLVDRSRTSGTLIGPPPTSVQLKAADRKYKI